MRWKRVIGLKQAISFTKREKNDSSIARSWRGRWKRRGNSSGTGVGRRDQPMTTNTVPDGFENGWDTSVPMRVAHHPPPDVDWDHSVDTPIPALYFVRFRGARLEWHLKSLICAWTCLTVLWNEILSSYYKSMTWGAGLEFVKHCDLWNGSPLVSAT